MRFVQWMSLCVWLASGCTAGAASMEEAARTAEAAGKLDSFFEPTLHGELVFGARDTARFSAEESFHAWDFTLPGRATVIAETRSPRRGARMVDTIMYLYRLEDGAVVRPYVERNDDGAESSRWSRIERVLRAGSYRLIVKGGEGVTSGSFALSLACTGRGCTAEAAPSTLRVPLLTEDHDSLMADDNPRLLAAGLMPYPEFVVLSADNGGKEYSDVVDYAGSDQVVALYPDGAPYPRAYGTPDDYEVSLEDGRKVSICYAGDAADVAALLFELPDNVFSDQFVIWAYRHDGEKWKYDDVEDEFLPESWDEFDESSKEILVIYTISDGGDDPTSAYIAPCAD